MVIWWVVLDNFLNFFKNSFDGNLDLCFLIFWFRICDSLKLVTFWTFFFVIISWQILCLTLQIRWSPYLNMGLFLCGCATRLVCKFPSSWLLLFIILVLSCLLRYHLWTWFREIHLFVAHLAFEVQLFIVELLYIGPVV